MEFVAKRFYELSNDELWDIYRLRAEVFVVEQRCAYQDIDVADKVSVHLMAVEDGALIGYLRVIPPGLCGDDIHIGRVISVRRRCGIGRALMAEGVRIARQTFDSPSISIEAQLYAAHMYSTVGFRQTSGIFMLDGQKHVDMKLVFEELDGAVD